MTGMAPSPTYSLAPDEKTTSIIMYTDSALIRGEVVTKEAVRVSTWLRTHTAPEYLRLHNVHFLYMHGSGSSQGQSYAELFIPTANIVAYHLVPPSADPTDYDPSEPNRKMEPVTVLVGSFRLNGHIRMATQSNLAHYLETAREVFVSLYDTKISNPNLSGMGSFQVPMVLARAKQILFVSGK